MKIRSVTGVIATVSASLYLVLSAQALHAASIDVLDDNAQTAIKALGGALQAEIKGAMKQAGPVAAIAACNEQAMPITAKTSIEQGMDISRTALRIRNPDNQADSWELEVLQQFQERQAEGEPLMGMVYSAIVEQEGQQVYRMMRAIPTQAVCLNCHGNDLDPEVAQKLTTLYPQDKATGFAVGDLRGAFSVRKVL